MSESERVDVLVLGSGEAGKYLAWHLASTGQRTAVVERKLIGGSCPNTNCLPSKNEIWSAKVADLVRHADRFGTVAPAVAVDMAKVLAHKREMIDGLIAMHLERYRASGAELIRALAGLWRRRRSRSASTMAAAVCSPGIMW